MTSCGHLTRANFDGISIALVLFFHWMRKASSPLMSVAPIIFSGSSPFSKGFFLSFDSSIDVSLSLLLVFDGFSGFSSSFFFFSTFFADVVDEGSSAELVEMRRFLVATGFFFYEIKFLILMCIQCILKIQKLTSGSAAFSLFFLCFSSNARISSSHVRFSFGSQVFCASS